MLLPGEIMAKKPTPTDADLILKLYDLRREAVMRNARRYMGGEFWPASADDVIALLSNPADPNNAFIRQVLGYWDMAASLVVFGTLNEALFVENAGEMFFYYAKIKPFLKQIRERFPTAMLNIEKVAERTPQARRKLEAVARNVALVREKRMGAGR